VAEDGKTRKILAAAVAEETTGPAEAEATRVVNVVTATTEEISTTAIKGTGTDRAADHGSPLFPQK
jgi:hypothetical protein